MEKELKDYTDEEIFEESAKRIAYFREDRLEMEKRKPKNNEVKND